MLYAGAFRGSTQAVIPTLLLVLWSTLSAKPQVASDFDRSHLGVNLLVRVTDSKNAGLAADVQLQQAGTLDRSSRTDEHGDCLLPSIPAGEYVLVISLQGQERWRQELVLSPDETSHSELILLATSHTGETAQVSAKDLNVPRRARRNYVVGSSNTHNNKWADAEANFRHAIAEWPEYMRAFNALGVVLAMQNRNMEAEGAFRKAIALDTKFSESHLNLALLLVRSNRANEAVTELGNVLRADPSNHQAVALLLDTYFAVHNDDEEMHTLAYADAHHVRHDPELHFLLAQRLEARDAAESALRQYRLYLGELPNGSHSEDARRRLAMTR